MEYTVDEVGTEHTLALSGKFGFADSSQIRTIVDMLPNWSGGACKLDLTNLDAIDSAGLGMMILINDAAKDAQVSLRVTGASGQVKKMLEISKFSDLMQID